MHARMPLVRWIPGVALLALTVIGSFFAPDRVAWGEGAYSWIDVPEVRDGVAGGFEADGQAVFVAAGHYQGRWIIGKGRGRYCWVPYGGGEHICARMKKLECDRSHWVTLGAGFPPNAVSLDESPGGPRYFVARGRYQGLWVPGKTRAGANVCWIPFAGKERIVHEYQILVAGWDGGRREPAPGVATTLVYVIPRSRVGDPAVRDYLRMHEMRVTREIDGADAVLAVCRKYASNHLAREYSSVQDLEQAIDAENSTWSNGPNLGLYLYERTTRGTWKQR